MDGDARAADRSKYLPALGDGTAQPPNGYISDFYKNKKQPSSDGSTRVGMMQLGVVAAQSVAVGNDYPGNVNPNIGANPAQKLNKISSKKFFKSKIDFAAPIKSL